MTGPLEKFKDGWTIEDMEEVIQRNDPKELLGVPICVSMDPPDCKWSEKICILLSKHPDFHVRGNAILGFGHLAMTCENLDKNKVKPIIEKAMQDAHEYVRGQAECAVMDTEDFLGWKYEIDISKIA